MGALWLMFWVYAAIAVIYLLVSVYSRSVRREKLEEAWEEEDQPVSRETYVTQGLAAYDKSFRRKAIALIFLIPIVLIALISYIQNVR